MIDTVVHVYNGHDGLDRVASFVLVSIQEIPTQKIGGPKRVWPFKGGTYKGATTVLEPHNEGFLSSRKPKVPSKQAVLARWLLFGSRSTFGLFRCTWVQAGRGSYLLICFTPPATHGANAQLLVLSYITMVCCIWRCLHIYKWTSPSVRQAQNEDVILFQRVEIPV